MNQHITSLRTYTIWLVMSLFVAYNYFLKASYGVVIEDVAKRLSIDYVAASILSSVFFYIYAFIQLIIGVLLTHASLRNIVTSAILLCATGTLVFTWTTDFIYAIAARLMMGAGTAFSLTTTIYLIGKLFSPKYYASMVGLTNCIANVCGSGFGVMLFVKLGHGQKLMATVGAIGILIAFATWLCIPSAIHGMNERSDFKFILKTFCKNLTNCVKSSQIWSIALYGGIMLGSLIAFGNLWNIPFQRASGLNMEVASFMNLLVILGIAFGSVAIGWFSDYLQQRLLPAILATLGAGIMISIILYLPNAHVLLKYITLFFFGFFCGSFCLCYAIVHDYIDKNLQAMAIGFVTALTSLIGGSLQYIIGQLLHFVNKKPEIVMSNTSFTINDYQYALTIIPGVLCIALLLLYIIKNRLSIQASNKKL